MSTAFLVDREIFENGVWVNVLQFRLFFLIMGNARFSEKPMDLNGIKINCGQWLRSYRKLQEDLQFYHNNAIRKYSLSQIKKAIDDLINLGRLKTQDTELGTLFTVVNYRIYQDIERYKKESLEQASNRLRTGLEHTTNNKDKDNKEHKENKEHIIWRENFDFYLQELEEEFTRLINDTDFINKQQELNPGLNIKLSLRKAKENYWEREAGWKKKKASRTNKIDWEQTFINALGLSANKVYLSKDEKEEIRGNIVFPEDYK